MADVDEKAKAEKLAAAKATMKKRVNNTIQQLRHTRS